METTLNRKQRRVVKRKLKKSGDMAKPSYFNGRYLKRTNKLPKFGETDVLTPNLLVTEMWIILMKQFENNPYNIKVLDPSCGRGPFLVKAYEILFNDVYSDVEDVDFRNKLCIDSLYGFDINPIYVRVAKKELEEIQKHYGATVILEPNIVCGDFLKTDINMKFDVIVGNPPYQSSTRDENGANALWLKFGVHCSTLLNKDGYLCIVHPDSWMSHPNNPNLIKGRISVKNYRSRMFSNLSLCYVRFGETLSSYFKEGIDISVIVMKNGNVDSVQLESDKSNVTVDSLSDGPIIKTINPLAISIFNKFYNNADVFTIISNTEAGFSSDTRKWTHISNVNTDTHVYPQCNTSAQYNKDIYLWSTIPNTNQFLSKVIFSDSGYSRPFYDTGEYGLSSHSIAIECNELQSKKLIEYLNSKELSFFNSFFAQSGSASKLSPFLNKIPKIDSDSDSDILSLLANTLKLTSQEKNYIENAIK